MTKTSKPKIIRFSVSLTLIVVMTTILVRMFTLETEVKLVQTVEIPNLPAISEITPGDYQQLALALDGKTLQKTSDTPHPTASTAKMILGLAVMDKKPFNKGEKGEMLTITPEFYQKYLWYHTHNGSTTAVTTGEEISQYDALASVFLASSNNLADSLAIWAFGSLEEYQKYAAEMLENMGIENTHLGEDASGYSETTTSTAEDLAIIATNLLENPVLKEIVGLKSYTVPVAGELKNTNKILGDALNNGVNIIGVKTGYIGDISGYNLISAYEMDGHLIALALLGASTRQASFDESKAELLRLSEELTPTEVVQKDQSVGYFETWWNSQHEIKTKDALTVLAPEDHDSMLELNEQNLKATIGGEDYIIETTYEDFAKSPTFIERFLHLFGWQAE